VISSLLCVLALAVAEPQRVLVIDFDAVSVPAADADAATRIVAAAAASVDGIQVLSSADLRRIASLETERLQAGCADDASCMAELAGALNAGRVLYGSLSRLGTTTTVVLSLYDAGTTTVARRSFDVSDMSALPPLLRKNTTALLSSTTTSTKKAPKAEAPAPVLGLATLGGGLGVALLGGATALVAEYGFVQDRNGDGLQKPTWQMVGIGGVAVAGVGLAVATLGGVLMAGGQ
jgi:hypothetical protein